MNLHLLFFSPNGTTKKTVRKISQGFKDVNIVEHDLLSKESRKRHLSFTEKDIVILGIPSAAMLYGKVEEVFGCISGNKTPIIGVVMYGNGYYGVALKEFAKRAKSNGFVTTALSAFIGENAVNREIATGRPDAQDQKVQLQFGQDVYKKLISNGDIQLSKRVKTGWSSSLLYNFVIAARHIPQGEYNLPISLKTKKFLDSCVECGMCEKHCPVSAINLNDKSFNLKACIGCNSCLNKCPNQAIIQTSRIMKAINKDFKRFENTRQEPTVLL